MAARRYPPPEERLLSNIRVAENGCWIWLGGKHMRNGVPTGYGHFNVDKKRHYVHRWAYAHFVGPIPEGMTIDHACHNRDDACPGGITCLHRACVNPAHLEAVTNRVNVLRGKGSAAVRARTTHCPRGHALEGDNLYVDPSGHRRCRACQLERQKTPAAREYARQWQRELRRRRREQKA